MATAYSFSILHTVFWCGRGTHPQPDHMTLLNFCSDKFTFAETHHRKQMVSVPRKDVAM